MSAPGSEDRAADFGRAYWRSAASASDQLAPLTPTSIDEATFQMLADNLPTLCWVANGDGYIVWYNRRWHEYCGTTPDQMEGWGWTAVHDPELLPSVMERWTDSVATGEPFEMTFPLRGADGVFRPFLTRVQPVRDASGAVARWFGVNTEISDQVAVEQALRAERDRSRSVLDSMGEGFALLDCDFRVLDINAEGLRLETRSRDAIIGLTHWKAWPGTEESELGQFYKRAMVERVTATLEHRYVWPDGREAWLEVRVYPTLDGLAVFYRDITNRKLTDAALLESEQRLRLVVDSAAGHAILTTDAERRITSWSPGAVAIFGYSVQEAIGRSADMLFTQEDRDAGIPEQEVKAARTPDGALDLRWHLRKDGDPVFLHGTMHSVRDATGQEIGFLKIARDETESHLAGARAAAQAAEREAILGQLGEGVIVTDLEGRITLINEAAERLHGVKMLGVPPEEYANAYSLLTEDGVPYPASDLPLARAVLRGETVVDACWRIRRPDGSEVLAIGSARPVKGPDGTAIGAVLTVRDDTDRKRAEQKLLLLLGEMQHRVKNLAAVIDALARRSQPVGEPAVEAFVTRFLGRVHALLLSGELIVASSTRKADLGAVLERVLRPFYDPSKASPITLDGPPLLLPERTSGALALAAHELATNALKYGALKSADGRISIKWSVEQVDEGRRVRLKWKETGGPPPSTQPTRQGFGSRVIHSAVAPERKGTTDVTLEPDGLLCRFEFIAGADVPGDAAQH